ncbi:tyrosine-type recombinase/integrase [Brachybacterium sp. AOP42-E1-35]|uniref:tyrosine-type recombinase/integrase n=1 Tax=unclassified Brachybacterium TaxID=2623841 RepID=UPI00402AE96A
MSRREFGQIDRQRSGRYRARFTAPDGRLVSAPVTFAQRREAVEYLARVRGQLLSGRAAGVVPTPTTLADYAASYLRTSAPSLRPRTRDLYQRLTDRWLLPAVGEGTARVQLGPLSLSDLSPVIVREWHAAVVSQAHAEAVRAAADRRPSAARAARSWAVRAGLEVSPTGRLPRAVVEAWERAGSPRPDPEHVREDAGRTVAAQAYRLLHAVLARAVDDGLIAANPARVKGAATVEHPERLPLTPEQVSALAEAIAPRYRAAVLVAAWSGLRPGEVFALRRGDVAPDSATVTVRRTLLEIPGEPLRLSAPKTRAGRRTVSLPASVAETLAEHLETYTGPDAEALVFGRADGLPLRSGDRARALRPAREAIGRPDVTWHHLRHTGATLAAQAGATSAELQRRIGHSDPRAAAIYQHAGAERDRWIADRLDAIASGPSAPPEPTPPAPQPDPETAPPEPAPAAPVRSRAHLSLIRSA